MKSAMKMRKGPKPMKLAVIKPKSSMRTRRRCCAASHPRQIRGTPGTTGGVYAVCTAPQGGPQILFLGEMLFIIVVGIRP